MNETRGNLYLLTGLVLGLAIGLLVSLVISPVQYVDLPPGALADTSKEELRRTIALAYAANGNLARARERLVVLDGSESTYLLAAQAQRMLAANGSPQEARALAVLAADLANPPAAALPQETPAAGVPPQPSATASGLSTREATLPAVQTPTLPPPTRTPTITLTPAPTFTPLPTATPQPVRSAPFVLQARREVCDRSVAPGLLQIQVADASGAPLPGVPVTITWQDGEETFFTGLAPEIGPGYADFQMASDVVYTLKVGPVSELVEGFAIPGCGGGWWMEFQEGRR